MSKIIGGILLFAITSQASFGGPPNKKLNVILVALNNADSWDITVKDTNGRLLDNATISVKARNLKALLTAKTDRSGVARLEHLRPEHGDVTITVSKPGYISKGGRYRWAERLKDSEVRLRLDVSADPGRQAPIDTTWALPQGEVRYCVSYAPACCSTYYTPVQVLVGFQPVIYYECPPCCCAW